METEPEEIPSDNVITNPLEEVHEETAAKPQQQQQEPEIEIRECEKTSEAAEEEEPQVVVKAEYIPESQEIKCMICYSTVKDDPSVEEEDVPVPEEPGSSNKSPYPKLPTIYRAIGVRVSSRMKSFYEEFKPPMCSECLETSQKAKEVVEQLEELEKILNTFGEEIKQKLITSFEEIERERDVYGDPMEGLCSRMITVNKIREDVMKDISKRSGANLVKKPGRAKQKSKAFDDVETRKRELDPSEFLEQGYEEKESKPGSKENMDQKLYTQTASGRIVKRPKIYYQPDDDMDSESEEDAKPLEVILEEGKETEEIGETFEMDMDDYEENEENPDPEWSPGHIYSDHEDVPSSSSGEDSDLESLLDEEEGSDYDSKNELANLISPLVPKRKRGRKASKDPGSSSPKKVAIKVPVKVVAEDGEEFDGELCKNKDVIDEAEAELIKFVEPGAVIPINDKLIKRIRIKCSEGPCIRTFYDIARMKLHVLQKHKGVKNPFSCSACDKAFSRRNHLKLHMKEHGNKILEINAGAKKYRACHYDGCDQKYRNKSELQIHIRKIHTHETPFKCDYCDEGFISALKREFHVETVHVEIPPLKCEYCPRGFFRQHRLRDHIKSHTKERSYLCEICSKSFSQPAYLRYHQTQHKELDLEPYKCDQCDRTFATPVNLRIHQQTQHMKEYRFRCDICNHGATHMSHLRLHMRTHSGDRPYRCDQCDKSFTRGSQLKIHIRSHTGERPYQCDLCDKNFTNSSKLRRHELTHSVEKPHKCGTCGRGFSQLTNLNSHVKSAHNKEKVNKKNAMQHHQHQQQDSPPLGPGPMQQSVPGFQPHQIFGIPPPPDIPPMQYQMVNPADAGVGTSTSYTEFLILNHQV